MNNYIIKNAIDAVINYIWKNNAAWAECPYFISNIYIGMYQNNPGYIIMAIRKYDDGESKVTYFYNAVTGCIQEI